MCGNFDMMAEESRKAFLKLDQGQLIRKFHLHSDENALYISMLGQEYAVDRKTGIITQRGTMLPAEHDLTMAAYDLFCFSDESAPLPEMNGGWETLAQLGGIVGAGHVRKLQQSDAILPFAGKTDEICKACEILGGVPCKGGDVSYLLPVFPFLKLWFQYWDSDEEFPASVQFLWDKNALEILHYEILFYTSKYVEEKIKELIE
ncbi:MAG: DUF3786 domain-containing protein [Bilifractor sp.]